MLWGSKTLLVAEVKVVGDRHYVGLERNFFLQSS